MLRSQLIYDPVELDFGTSGLRGLVTDMTDLECYINVAGFLKFQHDTGQLSGDVVLGGDLRDSTPRIMRVATQAIIDAGQAVVYAGFVPTPALALEASKRSSPGVMVTGSHIPSDRNGIKFYTSDGEVLKRDEAGIKQAVTQVRDTEYERVDSQFDERGMLRQLPALDEPLVAVGTSYLQRFISLLPTDMLSGKKIVVYQHSAVGRDMLSELMSSLGAEVIAVGRSEVFVPIDTENVTPTDQAYFRQLASEHAGAFAIISTDGDSDRPFLIDELGVFHRGDELGAVVAESINADFAAYPVSSSDALDAYLKAKDVPYTHTKIGSPYVIAAMQEAAANGAQRVVGWEVNGGFLTGADFAFGSGTLTKLATRDAFFPIVCALKAAADQHTTVSDLFKVLPARFTQAGLIDNFPAAISRELVQTYSQDTEDNRRKLEEYFDGFGAVSAINGLDGVRITFSSGDIAHLRPSGNAPQLRIYSVANSQERADEIVAMALAEPDGIFRQLERSVADKKTTI